MRKVINISLPESLKEEVDQIIEKEGYASRSEFIRELVRNYKERKVIRRIRQSEKDIEEGRVKEWPPTELGGQ